MKYFFQIKINILYRIYMNVERIICNLIRLIRVKLAVYASGGCIPCRIYRRNIINAKVRDNVRLLCDSNTPRLGYVVILWYRNSVTGAINSEFDRLNPCVEILHLTENRKIPLLVFTLAFRKYVRIDDGFVWPVRRTIGKHDRYRKIIP